MKSITFALIGCLTLAPTTPVWAQGQSEATPASQSQQMTPEFISNLFAEKSWLNQQWDKAQVSADVPIQFTAGGIDQSWKYNRTVQPAFIKGAQQLLDTWSAVIGTNTSALGITTGAYTGSADIGAQITFSRIFETKSDALLTKPYTFWQMVPWTHRKAIELLKSGEAVRLELFMDLGAGAGTGQGVGRYGAVNLGFNYTRGVRFLVDIYKLKNDRVRMRMVSQRNGGTSSTSLNLNLLSGADFGTGLIRNLVTRFVDDCNLAGHQSSHANIEDPPVDTEMFDYIFNLQNQEAQAAYDAVMKSIGSFDFKEMFNPRLIIQGHREYSKKMSQQFSTALSPAEQLFQAEKSQSQSARKVDRWFRGVTRTAVNGQASSTSCMNAWNLAMNKSVSKTLIKNFDRDDTLTYQIFENAATDSKKSVLFGTWETVTRDTINTLFNANYESDKSFSVTALSDVIVSHDQKAKDFSPSNYQELKAHLKYVLPQRIYSVIDWGLFEKTSDIKKNNVSYHYDIIFHRESLTAMKELTKNQIEESLRAYAQAYPESEWLDISPYQPAPAGKGQGQEVYNPPLKERFDYDISMISGPLEIILSKDPKNTAAQRALEFEKLRNNILFRQIGAGYMITLLPPERAESLVAFRVNLSGPEGMVVSKAVGSSGESKTYASVEYILKLLADRSFDLRLQVDAAGTVTPMSQKADISAIPLQ